MTPEQPASPQSPGPTGSDERPAVDKLRGYLRVVASRETAACVLLGVVAGVLGNKLGFQQLGVAGSAVVGVVLTRILEEQVNGWRSSRIWLLTFLFGAWEWFGGIMEGLQRGVGLAGKGLHLAGWQAQVVSVATASAVSVGALGASGVIADSSSTSPPATPTYGDATSTKGDQGGSAQDRERFTIRIGEQIDVGVPGQGAGDLEQPGSVDEYEFAARQNTHIAVAVTHANGRRDCALLSQLLHYEMFAPSGREMDALSRSVQPCKAHPWELPANGTYVLRVGAHAPEVGTYGLRLVRTRIQSFELDFGGQAVTVAPGSLGKGSGQLMSLGEFDKYRFDAREGDSLSVRGLSRRGKGECGARYEYLVAEVFDPSGSRLDLGLDHPLGSPSGDCEHYEFEIPVTGTYTLSVSARNDRAVRGAYLLALRLE